MKLMLDESYENFHSGHQSNKHLQKIFYLFYQEGQDHFHGNEKSLEDQKLMKASHNNLKDEDHSKINQGTC